MDIEHLRNALSLLLGVSFVVVGIRAFMYRRWLLAFGLSVLICLPLARFHFIPNWVALVFDNIGSFIVLYVINRNVDKPNL